MMLNKDDFRVYEDGGQQTITYFAQDDAALSVGLVFDTSASMKDKKRKASEAAASFFQTATSQDEFFLVEFYEHPSFLVPFTPDPIPRANPSCHACHGVMDPLGFSLENFDKIGAWRSKDRFAGTVIDSSGNLVDGTTVSGPDDLRKALLSRPEQFVQTMIEKLPMYALGRGLEPYDLPTVRKIVRDSAKDNYKFSSILMGIANSVPFQMSKVPENTPAKQLADAR